MMANDNDEPGKLYEYKWVDEPKPRGIHRAYPCKPDIFEATYTPADGVQVVAQPGQGQE